jgi:drug/metabolite transporter (DMT)-like permease
LTPTVVQPLDRIAVCVIVLVSVSWGFNQVATKLAITEIPPFTQAAIRSFGALPIVALWMRARGVPFTFRDGSLPAGIAAGLLFALEFFLIYRGLLWTTASRGIVFQYTAPFFVALGGRPLLGERMSAKQWVGLAMCFIGVAIALGVPDPSVDATLLVGDAMLLGGGGAWAATTLLIKKSRLTHIAAEKTLVYQIAVSGPLLALAALAAEETIPRMPSLVAWGALAYQTFWVVAITYTVWFALLKRYPASLVSGFTFLTPLAGVVTGHFALGDTISWSFAAATAVLLMGLVMVNRPPQQAPAAGTEDLTCGTDEEGTRP